MCVRVQLVADDGAASAAAAGGEGGEEGDGAADADAGDGLAALVPPRSEAWGGAAVPAIEWWDEGTWWASTVT